MRNRDNRLYANKIDYLMDTNEASDVFSGHNKYQTILFIVIIIFVVMLIAYLFGKFLGLNSHFQKILAAVNKITASIKTLLHAALPATAQAATITHGDVELHIDYYDILMYAIQIMIVMVVLSANVRCNLAMHRSVTPSVIWQPIRRPRLLERVYKPMCTPH